MDLKDFETTQNGIKSSTAPLLGSRNRWPEDYFPDNELAQEIEFEDLELVPLRTDVLTGQRDERDTWKAMGPSIFL